MASNDTPVQIVESGELVITSMTPGTDIEANFDVLKAHIEGIVAQYEGATFAAEDMALAKKHRAYLNGLSKSLNQRRIDVKREYTRPVDIFETRIKELDAPIKAAAAAIDEQVKDFEATAKAEKRTTLVEHWQMYAGALADAVPFERIEDPKWLNASTPERAACADIEQIAERIARDEGALTDLELSHPVEAKAEYFATLDMAAAIARSKALDDQEARARELEARKAEIAAERAAAPAPAPEPVSEATASPLAPTPASVDEASAWTIELTCTRAQLQQVVDYISSLGLTGRAVR